jgi:hypothetical protein
VVVVVGAEKRGAGVVDFADSLFFASSLGLGVKRPLNGAGEGSGFCSVVGLLVSAGFCANKLAKGFPALDAVLSCSAAAAGLGANKLPVEGGWNRPPAGAEGAAAVSLLENKDGVAPLVEAPNWNAGLGWDSSGFFSSFSAGLCVVDGAGVPNRFWNGAAGDAAEGVAAPNRDVEGAGVVLAAAGVVDGAGVVAELGWVVAPNNDVEGVDCSAGFAPNRFLAGVSAGLEVGVPNNEPAPGLAKPDEAPNPDEVVPAPKIDGFDCLESGDVCMESPNAVD